MNRVFVMLELKLKNESLELDLSYQTASSGILAKDPSFLLEFLWRKAEISLQFIPMGVWWIKKKPKGGTHARSES